MLDEHTFGTRHQASRLSQWMHDRRPALVATGTFWLVFLVLSIITLFTGWGSRAVTLVMQILLSLGAGFLAAWMLHRNKTVPGGYVRQGALAGFYLPLTTALVVLALAILIGLGSLGTLLPLMIPYFLFLPVELGACSAVGALGAKIFQLLFVRK